jgi:phosphate starvation-inducible protein PhoH
MKDKKYHTVRKLTSKNKTKTTQSEKFENSQWKTKQIPHCLRSSKTLIEKQNKYHTVWEVRKLPLKNKTNTTLSEKFENSHWKTKQIPHCRNSSKNSIEIRRQGQNRYLEHTNKWQLTFLVLYRHFDKNETVNLVL